MISKQTLLQVASNLNLDLKSQNNLKIKYNEQSYQGTQLTLSIINTFYLQRTLEDGVKKLSENCTSHMNWIEMVEEIKLLNQLQILQSPDQQRLKTITDSQLSGSHDLKSA